MNRYILVDGVITPCEDLMEWSKWMTIGDRIIQRDNLIIKDVKVRVSTVFLGIDHSFMSAGPPILFETMIFGGEHDQYQERYCTRDEAIQGHLIALEMVRLKNE